MKYNDVLRGMAGATAVCTNYIDTIHLICSGLHKLSRVSEPPAGMVLDRGSGGIALQNGFLEPDTCGCAGRTEVAIMSATPNRNVALGYSGVDTGKVLPTIFEIEVSKTSIGANLGWLSQFKEEDEYCYCPLTHLEVVGTTRLEQHHGQKLSVLRMKLTVDQRSMTVEQADRPRKDFLKQLVSSLEWDVRHWAKRQELFELLAREMQDMRAALQAVVTETEPSLASSSTTSTSAVSVGASSRGPRRSTGCSQRPCGRTGRPHEGAGKQMRRWHSLKRPLMRIDGACAH